MAMHRRKKSNRLTGWILYVVELGGLVILTTNQYK